MLESMVPPNSFIPRLISFPLPEAVQVLDHTTGVWPKENLGSSPTGCWESDTMIVTASKPDAEGFNAK
jgi:hypothetical protein